MRFGLLGPIEVRHGERLLPAGSGRERFVLATLLLNADQVTLADALIDAMWAEPPPTAKAQLHNIVSSLRRRLRVADDGLIVSRPAGYELRRGAHELDVLTFRRFVKNGRRAAADGDHTLALSSLSEAMSLWRGPALADIADDLAAGARQALHEEKLSAAGAILETQLALAQYDDVLRVSSSLITEHPYRERLHEKQMLALVGSGRRADALEHYQRTYRRFAEELGVEPGQSLRELEQQILRGETPTRIHAAFGPVIPRQLPPSRTELTGRDKLLTEITSALLTRDESVSPVMVLTGQGGVGKTALALATAHATTTAFPDGQLYAHLLGNRDNRASSHAVLGRFLRALGVEGKMLPEDPEERVAMYRSHLAGKRVLVVLDDAASEEQVRPLLSGVGGGRTLITSRYQLGALVEAVRWTVPVLTVPDAHDLLTAIVGRDRVAGEPDAAAAIVELCAQLPLAVSIAAARLATRPHWTLAGYHERLAAERGRLDELSIGDLDVRASIALSYDALDPDARLLFRRLGLVNAPTWPAWIVDPLVGAAGAHLLDQLLDVHLVEPAGRDVAGQSRFRLHDLVAEFAAERARADDAPTEVTDALSRLLSGWLALAAEADQRIPHDLARAPTVDTPLPTAGPAAVVRQAPGDWFEAERRALVLAVDDACRLGLADIAGALALRLSGFLALRSYGEDWETVLNQAVALVRQHGSRDTLVRLLSVLFVALLRRDRYAELPTIAAEELARARGLDDRESEVRALGHAAMAAGRLNRFPEAIDWAERAVTAARHPDVADSLLCDQLATLAFNNRMTGRLQCALLLLEEALSIDRAASTAERTAFRLYYYGIALLDDGQPSGAEPPLAEALRISQEHNHVELTAYLEQTLADVAIRKGQLSLAAERLDRARCAHENIGSRDGLAEALRSTGDLAAADGRWADAIAWLRRALHIWRRIGSNIETARTLARLERAHTAVTAHEAAESCCREYRIILVDLSLDQACLYVPPFYSQDAPT